MWSLKIKTNIIISIAKIYYVSRAHWQLLAFPRKLCLFKVCYTQPVKSWTQGEFFFYEAEVVYSQGNTFYLTFLNFAGIQQT